MFLYWFRYTCLLILSTRRVRNYTRVVAEANGLNFLQTRTDLATVDSGGLDQLHQSLDRDYELITYLLRHAGSYNAGGQTFEQFLLRLDYQLMRLWYRLVRSASNSLARRALFEMSSVVGHLANAMGERSAVSFRA